MNPADTKSLKTDIDEEKDNILAKYFFKCFYYRNERKCSKPRIKSKYQYNFKLRNI